MVHTPPRRAGPHVSQPTGFGSIGNSARDHNKAHPRQEEDGGDGSTPSAGSVVGSETPPTQTSTNSNADPVPAITGDWNDVFNHTWNTGGNATLISRQSELVLRFCPNESLQLNSEVLLLGDTSATANLALNTCECVITRTHLLTLCHQTATLPYTSECRFSNLIGSHLG